MLVISRGLIGVGVGVRCRDAWKVPPGRQLTIYLRL